MTVKSKIVSITNHRDFFSYAIAVILSTLLVGYAPSSIALGFFVFFAFRYAILNKVKLRLELMMILPIGLYLLFCASYFWSVDQQLTLKGMGRLIAFLIVPIAFSLIPRLSKKSLHIILKCFTISNVLLGLFFLVTALFYFLQTGDITSFTYHELVQILDLNAIYVSVFYSISFLFHLSKTNKNRMDFWVLAFLGLMILLLSSKTVIITIILCTSIYIVFYKGLRFSRSPRTFIFILLGLMISTIASKQVIDRFLIEKTTNFEEVLHNEKFNRVYPWTGTSIRILQLRNLKAQIQEDDILWKGFGLFASRDNLKQRHLAFNTYYGYHGYNYHNMYAQILSELGIFGLLILLSLLVFGIIKSFKNKHFIYFAFYILMAMTFLTESFLWVQRGLFLFVIIHCVLNRTVFSNSNKLDTVN